jgi:amino acid transporter
MLNRGIRRWDLVLLTINSIIGAGIFGLPSSIYALTGTYSLLSFLACALIVVIFIFCFAEVSSRFQDTGGPYLYAKTAFGPFPGFLMGWLLMLSRVFIYATLINLQVTYLEYFSPIFRTPLARGLTITAVTLLLCWVNHRGIRNMTRLNNILTIAKLLPLMIFIGLGLFHLDPAAFQNPTPPSASAFSQSVLLLVFAFGGFESVLVNTGEIHEPRKTLPFALITATLIVALFYVLIQVVSIGTLPGLADSARPLADSARSFMGNGGAAMISAGAFVSILATLNVLLLSGSRLPFALSMENQLPRVFSGIHKRYHTPSASLLLMSISTLLVSLAWTFLSALTMSVIIRITIYMMVCMALIRLRRKEPGKKDYYRLKAGTLLAFLGLGISAWLYASASWREIQSTLLFLFMGVVVYLLHRTFRRKVPLSSIGQD